MERGLARVNGRGKVSLPKKVPVSQLEPFPH